MGRRLSSVRRRPRIDTARPCGYSPGMKRRPALALAFAVCAGLLPVAGCMTSRHVPPPDLGSRNYPPVDPPPYRVQPAAAPEFGRVVQASAAAPLPANPKPKSILALSGGGMYGSFTAGVINGMTQSGQRPEFDVVTGISTGGLIAPLAFLGSDYDDQMKLIYTRVTRRDVFTYRNWATIPFRDAIATTAPLREIVTACMTDDVILKIAAEHKKGRRLYLGTTNLDTRRFVVWDMGAIAERAGDTRDRADLKAAGKLLVDIMIASCSLPGVFSPVEIEVEVDGKKYTELHADGGIICTVWVPPQVLDAVAPDPTRPAKLQPPAVVYVVLAGKPFIEVGHVRRSVFDVLQVFLATAQAAGHRRDVANLYHLTKLAGGNFHLAGVPTDMTTNSGGLDFDREVMGKLFDEGFRVGKGQLWWKAPPERAAGEVDPIRTGVKFTSVR
jgi:predicted acylesterase/phospholipase RssA